LQLAQKFHFLAIWLAVDLATGLLEVLTDAFAALACLLVGFLAVLAVSFAVLACLLVGFLAVLAVAFVLLADFLAGVVFRDAVGTPRLLRMSWAWNSGGGRGGGSVNPLGTGGKS
jgi:predicted ABC-type sugar transport system permease subunit